MVCSRAILLQRVPFALIDQFDGSFHRPRTHMLRVDLTETTVSRSPQPSAPPCRRIRTTFTPLFDVSRKVGRLCLCCVEQNKHAIFYCVWLHEAPLPYGTPPNSMFSIACDRHRQPPQAA